MLYKTIMLTEIWITISQYLEYNDICSVLSINKEIKKHETLVWNMLSMRDMGIEDRIYCGKDYQTFNVLCNLLNTYNNTVYDFCKSVIQKQCIITIEAFRIMFKLNIHKNITLDASSEDFISSWILHCMFCGSEYLDDIEYLLYDLYEPYEELSDDDVCSNIIYSDAYYIVFYENNKKTDKSTTTENKNMEIIKLDYNIEKWYYSYIIWRSTVNSCVVFDNSMIDDVIYLIKNYI